MTAALAPPGRLRVRVLLFGAIRDLAPGSELALEVPHGTTVSALRRHVLDALACARPPSTRDGLVESAAVAVDDGVLAESETLGDGAGELRVALLPPVCGG